MILPQLCPRRAWRYVCTLSCLCFLWGSLTAASGWSKASPKQIAVLGFHDVIDPKQPRDIPPQRRQFSMDYTVPELEKLLRYLLENDYYFLGAEELYRFYLAQDAQLPPELKGRHSIMLSFDDGYHGVYHNLLPLLRRLSREYQKPLKVVLFVNVGLLGNQANDIQYISCAELREGHQEGFFEVQSHGYTHRNFTELSVEELTFEARESQKYLQRCLEDPQAGRHFAYPFGAHNAQVEEVLKEFFASAYLYDNQPLSLDKAADYRLSRLYANRQRSAKQLIAKLSAL